MGCDAGEMVGCVRTSGVLFGNADPIISGLLREPRPSLVIHRRLMRSLCFPSSAIPRRSFLGPVTLGVLSLTAAIQQVLPGLIAIWVGKRLKSHIGSASRAA